MKRFEVKVFPFAPIARARDKIVALRANVERCVNELTGKFVNLRKKTEKNRLVEFLFAR